jgi:hypothetical protein
LVETLPYTPWRERGSVVDGEFRWRLGARPLDLAEWFEFGPDADGADGWIAQKPAILADHRDQVFVAPDDVESECREVAEAICEHLATHAPERPGELDPALHPLEAASRLVPDDLVVMVERNGRLVFGAGSVCFPNRWDLPSKVGLSMAEVHTPVARLNDGLETNIDRFLDRLDPDRSFWRLGWGMIDVPGGYAPPRPRDPVSVDRSTVDSYVRVERETLRRFPRTRCVLFTIRTYISPLASVLIDPESSAALSAAVASMPDDIRSYKDVAHHAPSSRA